MRIAIVNDLRLACEALRRVIAGADGFEVAWIATDGAEAVEKAANDRPDLILMDLIMPRMDGAAATQAIMSRCPCPILVVTSSVSGNIAKVYEAMGHGALDAVDTPVLGSGGAMTGAESLLRKLQTMRRLIQAAPARASQATSNPIVPRPAGGADPRPGGVTTTAAPEVPLVVIGSSTGGPTVLAQIVRDLPRGFGGCIVIVQHVDAAFAAGLARWLGDQCALNVATIRSGQKVEPGRVLVAETIDHLVMGRDRHLRYSPEPRSICYRPSVDVFFESVARHWSTPGVGVILTGMGRDGGAGLLQLRQAGWFTIAQDRDSCTIWGMPRAAEEMNAAMRVLPPPQIIPAILDRLRVTT